MAWTGSITTYCRAQDTTSLGSGTLVTNIQLDYPLSATPEALANGTSADQIDLGFGDTRTWDSTGATLDLTAITKASTNTNAATFTATKYIGVWNEGSSNDLVFGNAASNQHTPGFSAATTTVTIQEGGHIAFFNPTNAGWTTSSANNLKLAAAANTTAATLIILGED